MANAIDRFMTHLYNQAPRKFTVARALNDEIPFPVWKEELRTALLKTLGKWPAPVPLTHEIIETVDRPDHTRIKLTYRSEEALDTITYLLIPKNITEPRPGMVLLTGHGYGVRDTIGLTPDFKERGDADPGYHKDFGLALMRRGFVVIAPEPLGFGEMRLDTDISGNVGNSCNRISDNLLLLGRTMLAARVQQYMCALSLLGKRPEVDRDRIGAMGISGGGLACSFLTMLDPRVKAAVVSGYACMYRESIYGMHHCVDNFPFGLLNIAENDDLMSLIAPRPMLWEAGSRDPIFPITGVRESAATVAKVYEKLGVPELFDVDYFEGDHEISGRKAYDFLEKHL